MNPAALWIRCNLIGTRFASRGALRRLLAKHVDAVVFWWCLTLTASTYMIGWSV